MAGMIVVSYCNVVLGGFGSFLWTCGSGWKIRVSTSQIKTQPPTSYPIPTLNSHPRQTQSYLNYRSVRRSVGMLPKL
jgi:hypothetical protein